MVYFSFTKDMLRGKPIQIFEGAAMDLTYIDDIVKGCLAALDTAEKSSGSVGKKKMKGAQLRIYNLGNATPVEVGSVVEMLERVLKVKARRVDLPKPRNGVLKNAQVDISLAEKELGYKPTTDLKKGLVKFVDWYLSYHNRSTEIEPFVGFHGS